MARLTASRSGKNLPHSTSVQGVQARPVRPAQLRQHTMKSRRQTALIALGDIYITKGARAELPAYAINSATLLESPLPVTGQPCWWMASTRTSLARRYCCPTNIDSSSVSPNSTGKPPLRPEMDRRPQRRQRRKSAPLNDASAATAIQTGVPPLRPATRIRTSWNVFRALISVPPYH